MIWTRKKVLVTGATGLLGSHLTRELMERGAEVVALVRDVTPRSLFFASGESWQLDRRVIQVRGEVENLALLTRVMVEHEIEVAFHLAAQTIVGCANQSPIGTFKANIEGTWNLLEAARQYPKLRLVVIASSDKAYGNLHGMAYDETFPLRGEHPYDVSKSCADLISQSYAKTYRLPVVVTRCGNLFGPGDLNYSNLIPGIIRDALLDQRPIIRSDGKAIRDYIYVEDGVHAYLTLAENYLQRPDPAELIGEAFNFSYGLRLPVIDVVRRILMVTAKNNLEPLVLSEAKNEIPVQCLDSSKAREWLNWQIKFGFDEGLKRTVSWYRGEILGAI